MIFGLLRHLPGAILFALRSVFSERWMIIVCSLAFTTMLSIVPFTLIGLGFFPQFAGYHEAMDHLREYIVRLFVPGVGAIIQQYFDTFAVNASSLPAIGILGLFVSSGLLLLEIHATFHKVWDVSNRTPWTRRFLELWGLLTIPPILAVSSDWLLIVVMKQVGDGLGLLAVIAPYVIVYAVFCAIYIVFSPKRNGSLPAVLTGSFLATVLFFVAKTIFVYYISGTTLQNIVYGALAVIPMIQIWLFVFWVIVIFGAIVIERLEARLGVVSED